MGKKSTSGFFTIVKGEIQPRQRICMSALPTVDGRDVVMAAKWLEMRNVDTANGCTLEDI